jgi:hypothetical protein
MTTPVQICEVGPRDGLQIVSQRMPTEVKLHWIAQLAAAGLKHIEVVRAIVDGTRAQARRSRILCASETALHPVPRSLPGGQPNCPPARTARNNMQRGSSFEKDPACRAFSHVPKV